MRRRQNLRRRLYGVGRYPVTLTLTNDLGASLARKETLDQWVQRLGGGVTSMQMFVFRIFELFRLAEPLEHSTPLANRENTYPDVAVGTLKDRIQMSCVRAPGRQVARGLSDPRRTCDSERGIHRLHRRI